MKKDDLYLIWDAKSGQWVKTERFAEITKEKYPYSWQEYQGWPAWSSQNIFKRDYQLITLGTSIGNPPTVYTRDGDMKNTHWTDCYILKNKDENSEYASAVTASFFNGDFGVSKRNTKLQAEWKYYKSLKWTNEDQFLRQEQLNQIISLLKNKKYQEADYQIELLLTQPSKTDERPKFIKEIIDEFLSWR